MYTLFQREVLETELNTQIALYNLGLGKVPTGYLQTVFEHAIMECKTFPKPAHLVGIWDRIKMEVPETQEKREERPFYLTGTERNKLIKVLDEYPQFSELLEELNIENDANGVPTDDWWKRFNNEFQRSFDKEFSI